MAKKKNMNFLVVKNILPKNDIVTQRSFYGFLKFKNCKKKYKNIKNNITGFLPEYKILKKKKVLLFYKIDEKKVVEKNKKNFDNWIINLQNKRKIIQKIFSKKESINFKKKKKVIKKNISFILKFSFYLRTIIDKIDV
nr:hypothetical protein Cry52Nrm1_p166 [Cryptomonas curvata]